MNMIVCDKKEVHEVVDKITTVLAKSDLNCFEEIAALAVALEIVINGSSLLYHVERKSDEELHGVIDEMLESIIDMIKEGMFDGVRD